MTYLELVNDVLVRLREPTVSTVIQTTYSSLIGKFVNDAKRQIEDAYAWNVLGQTITLSTVAGTYSYSLTGSGQKFQVIDVLNVTSNIGMKNIDFASMNRKQNFSTPVSGIPSEYAFDDSTVVAVPDVLVVQNAYARALVERGEDGGLSSSEAYLLYKSMLSDYIALEGTRYPENQEFVAV
jgi:hypothetical protein